MFSEEFMSYLSTYYENLDVLKQEDNTEREIEFSDCRFKILSYVTVEIDR